MDSVVSTLTKVKQAVARGGGGQDDVINMLSRLLHEAVEVRTLPAVDRVWGLPKTLNPKPMISCLAGSSLGFLSLLSLGSLVLREKGIQVSEGNDARLYHLRLCAHQVSAA